MSVAFILNPTYSYVENNRLNQALEVTESVTAPIHYVEDLTISKTLGGNMSLGAPVVECTQIEAPVGVIDSVSTEILIPLAGVGGDIEVDGNVDLKDYGLKNVSSLTIVAGAPTAGYVLSSSDNAGTLAWIPDATGSTPSLSQVLAVSGDGGNQPITNVENLYVNGVINSADSLETPVLSVKTQDGLGYYVMTSNASGVDLNTKFTSDGLILHKVAAGSDITIQNDATNLVTLGTATGFADLQVGVLKYTSLDPAIPPGDVPTLSQVLAEGNEASTNIEMDGNSIFGASLVGTQRISIVGGGPPGATFEAKSTTNTIVSETNASFTGLNNVGCTTVTVQTNQISQDPDYPEYIRTSGGIHSVGTIYTDSEMYMVGNFSCYTTPEGTAAVVQGNASANAFLSTTNAAITGFSTVSIGQLIPTYKPLRTLWVSSNNTFPSPNGSYENPYPSIQLAITYAESVYDNTYWYINVLPGTYAGFTATKKVFVKGMSPSSPDGCSVGCQITSDITVAFDSNDGDMFNNQFSLSGFLVAGAKIVDSSTARHVINITDCYLYNDSGTGRLIDCRPSSSDCRLIILNSKLTNVSPSAGDPLVEMSVGMARFAQSQFQCSGVQNVIKFSGTSRVDSIVLCSFTSTNASAVIPAIVEITSSTSSAFTFANCSFVYSSATDKSASLSSCAIYANAAATSTVITILYNTFALTGTSNSSNFVVNHGAVPCVTLFFSNGATLNTTHTINGNNNTTKFSLQAVA